MSIRDNLNSYVYRKRMMNFLSTAQRERRFVSYDKAHKVVVLFESDQKELNINVRKLIAQLKQDGKKVSAWGYVDKKEVVTPILPDFRILNPGQTDFYRCPVLSHLEEMAQLDFDLLIDLTLKPVLPLQYLAIYSGARCKAGTRQLELPVYDVVVDLQNVTSQSSDEEDEPISVNEIYLYDQIIFYLKRIQTND